MLVFNVHFYRKLPRRMPNNSDIDSSDYDENIEVISSTNGLHSKRKRKKSPAIPRAFQKYQNSDSENGDKNGCSDSDLDGNSSDDSALNVIRRELKSRKSTSTTPSCCTTSNQSVVEGNTITLS